MKEIRQACVIGAGTMGHGIAQLFAQAGIPVYLADNRVDALTEAMRLISGSLKAFVDHGFINEHRAQEVLHLVRPVENLDQAVEQVDFVTESVKEDLEVKQQLFERMDAISQPHAVLASNTSSLSLSEIGGRVRRKSRLIVTHYFNPPQIVPTVEIVPDHFTDPAVVDQTCNLIARLGKLPVRLNKAIPGFLVNRVQAAMARELLALLEQNVASVAEMDKAIRGSIGFRMAAIGPLEMMDLGGLDLWREVLRNLCPRLHDSCAAEFVLSGKVEHGELGVKSGRGFYDWNEQKGSGSLSAKVSRRDDIFFRLLSLFYRLRES